MSSKKDNYRRNDNWLRRSVKFHRSNIKIETPCEEGDEELELAYCKFKDNCSAGCKLIQKSKRKKGLYYILCTSREGCSQKTFYPQKKRLETQEVLKK
jgi:hypothetical protein